MGVKQLVVFLTVPLKIFVYKLIQIFMMNVYKLSMFSSQSMMEIIDC